MTLTFITKGHSHLVPLLAPSTQSKKRMELKTLIQVFCLTIFFHLGLAEDFQILVFGGDKHSNRVELLSPLNNQRCELTSLPENANKKPFGGLMEGNVTICGGGMSFCQYLTLQSGELKWSKSYELEIELSTLVTTYDSNIWSYLARKLDYGKVVQWTDGSDFFDEQNTEIDIDDGSCSARKNHTHAIASLGKKLIFWYVDEDLQLQKWEEMLAEKIRHAGCGTVYHPDLGYQFISIGGLSYTHHEFLETTELFDLDSYEWHEGEKLPSPIAQGASVPHQNSVILAGGQNENFDYLDHFLQYDFQEGWLELPIKLQDPDIYLGAMRMPKGKLQCP